ncbi:MAG: hypothetical protein M3Z10_15045 [Gemmatimonadota bacterium]|nr:hypothetical protein [Gemmatimonadota bacterium]
MNSEHGSMDATRAAAAGAIGTGVLTALWLVEPSVGLPKIAVGQILSTFMSVSVAHLRVGVAGGWIAHLVFGILLALLYARFFAWRRPGHAIARGAIYGALVFLVAQALFMPLVGAGFFSGGDIELLAGSLLGHLAYGVVVAWIYDLPTHAHAVPTPRSA